ncbi:hypothetical protein DL89DRAFT_292190 [Linderina pennispora]|uniref:DNA recombination and repair protein Rad51-like C-terminal domain-containing protein n=1 Tax=Linderina pennispora TaxID=61395 RepID=A0A1Y1WAS5_9FUNG|nr:uncharacterized protein DL89DRAFT_292190 [Linderina pennispora]ORX70532.1 hypothetical protein DL89DRAFT_292190 [Linderina pennispora]
MAAAYVKEYADRFEDWETMGHAIRYKVPALLSYGQVRLLASSTSKDLDFLIEAGQMFRSWASEYNCAVVCVNQVKDVFESAAVAAKIAAEARATGQEGKLVEVPNELLRTRRWLELSFAPWCSRRTCEIALDDRGFYSFGINSHEIDEVGGVF